MRRWVQFVCIIVVGSCGWAVPAPSEEFRPEDIEFFEARIRPVLVEHCLECHGAKTQEAGLRLDSAEGWQRGGDSGPAVVPGKPDESRLLRAVQYDDPELQMPPDGKLPDRVIADIREWIRRGAPDPRRTDVHESQSQASASPPESRDHWAYQIPSRPQVPDVAGDDWSWTPVDRFIFQGLRRQGLAPAADAADAVWVRRVYFDLVGLPPEEDELEAFLADSRADRYERLVDRLLASPRFGERWARHWLDVVRFAESLTLRGFVLPEAWRYRDYVIQAMNEDLPYNQFITEQVAGDLLPGGDWQLRQRRWIATTFWMLGNTNLEEQDKRQLDMDVIDEQLDVLGKAILAQTISCARCHDHKFDPIPTRDYYALAAILKNVKMLEHANVSKWLELPLPLPEEEEKRYAEYENQIAQLQQQVEQQRKLVAQLEKPAAGAPPAIVAVQNLPGIVLDDTQAKKVGTWQVSQYAKRYVGTGYLHDQNSEKGAKTITFQPELPRAARYEVRLAYTPGGNRASNVPVTVFSADGEFTVTVNQKLEPPIDGHFVSLGTYRFENNNQGFVLISNEGTDGHVVVDAVQFLLPEEVSADKPVVDAEQVAEARRQLADLEKRLKTLREQAPRRPAVISVRELGRVEPMRIHRRGSPQNLGDPVERGFLSVATYDPPPVWPEQQSGRLELAGWLTSTRNPLVARVYVNRLWHWLFGAGLVRTPDNFGTTGQTPTHPELLDYLAVEFIEHDWSTKWLLRQLVLSHVYRLSSSADDALLAADPENRWWARAQRKRLEAECLRDAMLVAAGRLSLDMYGPGFPPALTSDYGFQDRSTRRSVYVPVFRNALPEIFQVFDFADPSLPTGARSTSTVAPQALFLVNHPFPRQQAEAVADRLIQRHPDMDRQIETAFQWLFSRPPTGEEKNECRSFLLKDNQDRDPKIHRERLARLVHTLFGTIEFRYID
ncbi:MAG: xanthan lyase [Pirellulaceae bacterium]|nr:MAG: xanthan lyase [Pirellulaceae bacterium]